MEADSGVQEGLPWLNVLSMDPNKIDKNEVQSELEAQNAETEVLRNEVAKMRKLLNNLSLYGCLRA